MTSPTAAGPDPSSGGSGSAGATDWAKVFDQLGCLGQEVVKRFADRASTNAGRVRQGTYGKNELVDDAEWFWSNLGDDVARGIEIWRTKPPAS